MKRGFVTAVAAGIIFASIVIAAVSIGKQAVASASIPPIGDSSTATNHTRTLSVAGVSSTKVSADRLTISFAVENQEKTASKAIQDNAQNSSQVINALEQAGVSQSEISTSQYSVYPVYDYVNVVPDCIQYDSGNAGGMAQKYCPPPTQKPILVGYRAVNGIVIQSTQLDKAGQWIDAAVNAGANRVDYLYFSASDQKQSETKNVLISQAIQDARAKADAALRPLGMNVVDVMSVNVDSLPVIYSKTGYQYSAAAGGATTPIIPGSQDVSASVQVTFEIGGNGSSTSLADATMSAPVGGTFHVTLDSNPSTGYHWQVKSIDNSIVKQTDDRYVAQTSGLVGAPGNQIITFQALAAGHTTIELQYVRPWDLQNPAKEYSVDLTVQ